MKSSLLLLSLLISTQSFADSGFFTEHSLYTSQESSIATSDPRKEANAVIHDVQDYYESGKVSVALNQKIKAILATKEELSLDEAVDMVVEQAQNVFEETSVK